MVAIGSYHEGRLRTWGSGLAEGLSGLERGAKKVASSVIRKKISSLLRSPLSCLAESPMREGVIHIAGKCTLLMRTPGAHLTRTVTRRWGRGGRPSSPA